MRGTHQRTRPISRWPYPLPTSQRQGTAEDGGLGDPCSQLLGGAREVEHGPREQRQMTLAGKLTAQGQGWL